ncbi:CopG antitoxin of type II toxin-antitoxin system [Malaciobacter marinus]|jgi:predicted DNA binding CopG/RHH family protein|uniref:CopG antitoxin of type II toxin-antitoxin system n=1 Tax=Malaciobacter marinus TaxID=505249 RepID=A0AB37A0I3_9BACT|nr:CopG family antitoxin [Malaciobacter marinus]PPK62186.1 CopG antitoxin of type II toxin-antitoxin system [Malaciobacter marinus]
MRKEYDFSNSIKNPYAKKVKKQISIKIEEDTITYFKKLAAKVGIPYQSLINSYLTDCAVKHVEPKLKWD